MRPAVPWSFIFSSRLSVSTRNISWTSCCVNASYEFLASRDDDARQDGNKQTNETRRRPAKALGELLGLRDLGLFEVVKEALQRERHREPLRRLVELDRHAVDGASERRQVEERLEQRVEVAGGALVLEARQPGLLAAVVEAVAKRRTLAVEAK